MISFTGPSLFGSSLYRRDLKISNLLLNSRGILKIGEIYTSLSDGTADFGMAREITDRPMTPQVVTVW